MTTIQHDVDTLTVCRVCLQEGEEEMSSIYESDTDSSLCIFEKIEKCGGIRIHKDADLPSRICNKCKAFLTIAYKFHVICKNSDNYLREFVTKRKSSSEDGEQEDPEYLYEYQTDLNSEEFIAKDEESELNCCETNAVNTEIGLTQTLDFEVDEYSELWLHENDLIEEDHAENSQASSIDMSEDIPEPESHSNTLTNKTKVKGKKIKGNASRKTLGITSDGTAVIHVKKAERQMHICEICGNSYPRKYALEAHMRRHRDERPFECEICHQAFHLNFQLTRHIRKHTGVRPYSCNYCQRSFADRSTMVKHERIHRNERPYSCETCGKSFTYSSVLKVHMLTHTGEKPFTCGICGKRFARAHHLRAHLETLLHQSDPRAKQFLKQIKREEGGSDESINV